MSEGPVSSSTVVYLGVYRVFTIVFPGQLAKYFSRCCHRLALASVITVCGRT